LSIDRVVCDKNRIYRAFAKMAHSPNTWSRSSVSYRSQISTCTSIDAAQLGPTPLTALQALCHTLPSLPSSLSPVSVEQSFPILVHGASTFVGLYAAQSAHLAGIHVIATASPKNFDLVRQSGSRTDLQNPSIFTWNLETHRRERRSAAASRRCA
jgi:hypothetical protein